MVGTINRHSLHQFGLYGHMKYAAMYYRLFVMVQALMFVFAIMVAIFLPHDNGSTVRRFGAEADVKAGLKAMLEMFRIDCGRYPTTAEGLKVLIAAPADGSLTNWRGPYSDPPRVPKDPWGHAYIYRFPAIHSTNGYDLYSLGPDGVSKSGGNDPDDIANWDKPRDDSVPIRDLLMIAAIFCVLAIPLLYVIRVVLAAFSPRFRVVAEQSRRADRVWFALVAILLVMVLIALLMPKLAGYAE